MRHFKIVFVFLFICFNFYSLGQSFDGNWYVEYVTPDNEFVPNSTGSRTISVATLDENTFAALTAHFGNESYYLAGYRNATHNSGLLGKYEYNPVGKKMKWIDGFNQVFLEKPKDLAAHNGIVYVANNDATHSIVAFEMREDSVYTYPQRFKTGDRDIWAIDISASGHVFVTVAGDSSTQGAILVIDDPVSSGWNSIGSKGTILHEITLPNAGEARGITVNADASIIYVSNYLTKEIYCYIGNPASGYDLYPGFIFNANSSYEALPGVILEVGPWGLQFMDSKNLLFVGHDASYSRGEGYNYGRYYILNANTGTILDTIDVAEWNFSQTNVYNNPDTLGTASGYAATYNLDFDANFNIYAAAYYGWSIEKWLYSDELPTVEILITDIKKTTDLIPKEIKLEQNYPNPFNPSTTIEFQIDEKKVVNLSIFNVNGELITEIIRNEMDAGSYKITFDASNLATGTYLYRLITGENTITKKMLLLK